MKQTSNSNEIMETHINKKQLEEYKRNSNYSQEISKEKGKKTDSSNLSPSLTPIQTEIDYDKVDHEIHMSNLENKQTAEDLPSVLTLGLVPINKKNDISKDVNKETQTAEDFLKETLKENIEVFRGIMFIPYSKVSIIGMKSLKLKEQEVKLYMQELSEQTCSICISNDISVQQAKQELWDEVAKVEVHQVIDKKKNTRMIVLIEDLEEIKKRHSLN